MTQSKTEDSQSLRDSDDLISYMCVDPLRLLVIGLKLSHYRTGPAVLSPPESEHDPYSPESRGTVHVHIDCHSSVPHS